MSVKPIGDGYEVDIRPRGRNGKRIRRRFKKKSEAIAFERYTLANADKKEWLGASVDRRTLSELLDLWWLYHGQNTETGEIEKRQINKTITALDNPAINRLTKRMIMEHRSKRLADGISPSTINRDMYRLSGMLTTLIKIEELNCVNPINGITPLAQKEALVTFLSKNEIARLLETLTGDDLLLARFCLSTGARWGEAYSLMAEQVINGRVTFLKTKNGKKRTIPIAADLEKDIKGKKDGGRLFNVDYDKFCVLLKTVKPDLPKNQASHVLRHTFASWFVMNGGNLVALQKILGHASIQQTMTYAHLAPDYLQTAVTLNPLNCGA